MSRRYILDTNALGDLVHLRHGVDRRVKEVRQKGCKVGTCPPILGELLFGAENSQSRDRNLKLIRIGLVGITMWPYDGSAG